MHRCECVTCKNCPNEAKISARRIDWSTGWWCVECFDLIIQRVKNVSEDPTHYQHDEALSWLARRENHGL